MRALKRLKEQLKHWREACGCGFDPNLLSDVSRQVIVRHHALGVAVGATRLWIRALVVADAAVAVVSGTAGGAFDVVVRC